MTATTPRTAGVHHVGLNVPDLGAAKTFFVEALMLSQPPRVSASQQIEMQAKLRVMVFPLSIACSVVAVGRAGRRARANDESL